MEALGHGPDSVPKYLSNPRVIHHRGGGYLAIEKLYADGVRVYIEHGLAETAFPNGDLVIDEDGEGTAYIDEDGA